MYWRYWKRGWWSWLLQLAVNMTWMIIYLPSKIVFATEIPPFAMTATMTMVGLLVIVPLTGWLFEVFARNSDRITSEQQKITE